MEFPATILGLLLMMWFKCRSCGWRQYGHYRAATACHYRRPAAIVRRFASSNPDHRNCCPPPESSLAISHRMLRVLRRELWGSPPRYWLALAECSSWTGRPSPFRRHPSGFAWLCGGGVS
uniref:(northern house mosquito) hypothetical protein n=1 Tax=Culex pipiens TaxID=7175 RepID=A0A8D8FMY9_CULPI